MADVSITPANAIKVTLMVAVAAFALRAISNATGIGSGVTRFLP